MDCKNIHMYLLNEENQTVCPFCDERLQEIKCRNKMLGQYKYNYRRF